MLRTDYSENEVPNGADGYCMFKTVVMYTALHQASLWKQTTKDEAIIFLLPLINHCSSSVRELRSHEFKMAFRD